MRLSDWLVDTFQKQLAATEGWLDKVEAFAAGRDEEPGFLLDRSIAPDMFPLAGQLRFLAFLVQEPLFRLRGQVLPDALLQVRVEGWQSREQPGSWASARRHLADAAIALEGIERSSIDAASDNAISHELPNGMIFDMTGWQYARDWALPQAAFHHVTTYAILRQAGLDLGKVDYVPHMFAYLRAAPNPEG